MSLLILLDFIHFKPGTFEASSITFLHDRCCQYYAKMKKLEDYNVIPIISVCFIAVYICGCECVSDEVHILLVMN